MLTRTHLGSLRFLTFHMSQLFHIYVTFIPHLLHIYFTCISHVFHMYCKCSSRVCDIYVTFTSHVFHMYFILCFIFPVTLFHIYFIHYGFRWFRPSPWVMSVPNHATHQRDPDFGRELTDAIGLLELNICPVSALRKSWLISNSWELVLLCS